MFFSAIPSYIVHYSVRQKNLLRRVPVTIRPLEESAMAGIDPLDDAGRRLDIKPIFLCYLEAMSCKNVSTTVEGD